MESRVTWIQPFLAHSSINSTFDSYGVELEVKGFWEIPCSMGLRRRLNESNPFEVMRSCFKSTGGKNLANLLEKACWSSNPAGSRTHKLTVRGTISEPAGKYERSKELDPIVQWGALRAPIPK